MSIDILKERIKSKKYAGIYFFYGQEEYTKDRYTELLRKCVAGCPMPEFNHIRLDASQCTADDALDAVTSLPAMWEYKLVEITGIDFSAVKKDMLDGLALCLDQLDDACVLLFSFRAGELDDELAEGRKSGKGGEAKASAAASFISLLKERAITVNFARETGDKLFAWIKKHFSSRHAEIDNGAVYTLVDVCGNDMYVLIGEIEKLAVFCEGRSVTRDDVLNICCKNESFRTYELSSAVMKGDLLQARRIAESLRRDKVDASLLILQLGRAYAEALMVLAGSADGKSFAAISTTTGIPQYRISAILTGARRIGDSALCRAVVMIDDADRLSKTSRQDPYLVADTLICRLCTNER